MTRQCPMCHTKQSPLHVFPRYEKIVGWILPLSLRALGLIYNVTERADFDPWAGDHVEDVLDDQSVKHGFNEKLSLSSSETGTARQSLYGTLKQDAGLQALSTLFDGTLRERQAHIKFPATAPSGPPPRVTLTETRRKAFLNDLANTKIPLKKLIRTIPQGIKGVALLDHCFSHQIPVGRAIWFAKAVGSNEIRSLRRKSSSTVSTGSTENKWLREWTSHIEQFIDSSFEAHGHSSWRLKFNYALILASRLYYDGLMERDHYLGWITDAVTTSELAKLASRLLLVSQHHGSLGNRRKFGRRLAEKLLDVLQLVAEGRHGALEPLLSPVRHTLEQLSTSNPSSLLLPKSWSRYANTIEREFNRDVEHRQQLYDELRERNARVDLKLVYEPASSQSCQNMVVAILDGIKLPFQCTDISGQCRSVCASLSHLVLVVLGWAISRFRTGEHRVILAAHLLQLWHSEEDIHPFIAQFFASKKTRALVEKDSLGLLVRELVRAHVFSVGRYIQWLSASGQLMEPQTENQLPAVDLHEEDETDSVVFRPTQVLAATPLYCMHAAVKNLRNITLSRAGFAVVQEEMSIKAGKLYVASRLPKLLNGSMTVPSGSELLAEGLGWTIAAKAEVMNSVRKQLLRPDRSSDQGEFESLAMTQAEFRFLRRICEESSELMLLAEVIGASIDSGDDDLLASLADAVNYHLYSFSAQGSLNDLHSRLFAAYLTKRTSERPMIHLLESLISLATSFPSSLISISQLQLGLIKVEDSPSINACSPVSDGMAESLQQAGSTFVDEIEAILSSGDRMEERTMTRLFSLMAIRLEQGQCCDEAGCDETLCTLHARLRIFGVAQYDRLFAEWLTSLLSDAGSRVQYLLPLLIRTGCVCFETCINIFLVKLRQTVNTAEVSIPAQRHGADFVAAIDQAKYQDDPISYRLTLENENLLRNKPIDSMEFRARVIPGSKIPSSGSLRKALIHAVVNVHAMSNLASQPLGNVVDTTIQSMIPLSPITSKCGGEMLLRLSEITDHLSTPCCRLYLQRWAESGRIGVDASEDDAIVGACLALSQSGVNESWLSYLSVLSPQSVRLINRRSQEACLASLTLSGSDAGYAADSSGSDGILQATNYMKVISHTAFALSSLEAQASLPTLLEKLATLLRAFLSPSSAQPHVRHAAMKDESLGRQTEQTTADCPYLHASLRLLLQLVTVQWSVLNKDGTEPLFSSNPRHKQAQQDAAKLTILLARLVLRLSLTDHARLLSDVYDVMLMVADELSDEARALCLRVLKEKAHDPRIEYALGGAVSYPGNTTSGGDNLMKADFQDHHHPHHQRPRDDYGNVGNMHGLQICKDGKCIGPYEPRPWEMLEGGIDASISLSLFDARKDI